jgi:hypothetical protein
MRPTDFDDSAFDAQEVLAGAWVPGPYGPDDQRGTFNEVTPEKTAASLARLDLTKPVKTYSLSEMLFNGFPAHGDREFRQTLFIRGSEPPEGFGGICPSTEPISRGLVCSLEERVSTTFNMGTKINGLHHAGVGGRYYNGFETQDIAEDWGTSKLGMETQGAIVTRGVVVDVLGHKVDTGAEADVEVLSNGKPMLREAYRITVEDLEAALDWEGVADPIGPGDVVLFRSGWRELIEVDPERYLSGAQPGPFLRECRYLAARKVAIIGIDCWFFGAAMKSPWITMQCHQELAGRYGVHVGEAVRTDPLADDGVYDFVFSFAAQNARGAVSSNAPLLGLGQP